MKSATVNELKKELAHVDEAQLRAICLRLAKYKVENKELLTYLLYESHDEQGYIEAVKDELATEMDAIDTAVNAYYIKKSLRKILRRLNRQVRYSGIAETEIELRIRFCELMRAHEIPMREGSVLSNIYQQQIKRVKTLLGKLPEDKQADYMIPR